MEKYKELIERTIINETTNEVETIKKEHNYIVKTWFDLTDEEKEEQIQHYSESIYEDYQNMIYDDFKYNLDYLKDKYKNIDFDTIYLDSNSQGGWIDEIKKFRCYYSIEIYGETLEVDDIDLHISKYIKNITKDEICVSDYYVDAEKMEKITNTKKYKEFINNILTEVNQWIDDANSYCENILNEEYNYPSNIHNENDADYLNSWFEDMEFTYDI